MYVFKDKMNFEGRPNHVRGTEENVVPSCSLMSDLWNWVNSIHAQWWRIYKTSWRLSIHIGVSYKGTIFVAREHNTAYIVNFSLHLICSPELRGRQQMLQHQGSSVCVRTDAGVHLVLLALEAAPSISFHEKECGSQISELETLYLKMLAPEAPGFCVDIHHSLRKCLIG